MLRRLVLPQVSGLVVSVPLHRETHAENCPDAHGAIYAELATQFFDDTITDGQSQSGSLPHRFGGKEGIEYAREIGLRNSFPRISHLDYCMLGF